MQWCEVRPLLPDELMRQRARRWMEIVALKQAIHDGIGQARDEHAARKRLAGEPAGQVG